MLHLEALGEVYTADEVITPAKAYKNFVTVSLKYRMRGSMKWNFRFLILTVHETEARLRYILLWSYAMNEHQGSRLDQSNRLKDKITELKEQGYLQEKARRLLPRVHDVCRLVDEWVYVSGLTDDRF